MDKMNDKVDQSSKEWADQKAAEHLKFLHKEHILKCRGEYVHEMNTKTVIGNLSWAKREYAKTPLLEKKAWVEIFEFELTKHKESRQ